MSAVRILIAEDHPMFRDGLVALLDGDPRFTVAAAAADTDAAVAAAREAVADGDPVEVAVLDVAMPGGGGLVACRAIRADSPATRVLMLTSYDGAHDIAAALDAGAQGYVVKSASPEEIVAAVAATAAGGSAMSESVLRTLTQRRTTGAGDRPFPELTDRELDVLIAMAAGLDNHAIAQQLGLSGKTVRNYVSNVLVKLSCTHRAAAVAEAHRRGLAVG